MARPACALLSRAIARIGSAMARASSSGDGYGSSLAHLADELHRCEGLLRAHLLRFKLDTPEEQRERFWHLPDDYLEDQAGDLERSPFGAYEPEADVAEVLAWVDERRKAIDLRVAATRSILLRLPLLEEAFGLGPPERDVLLLALLPLMHSRYRRLFGVLQLDAARTLPTGGFLAEALARSPEAYATCLRALSGPAPLAAHRLVVLGGTDDDPVALRTVSVEDRVLSFLAGEDEPDHRLRMVARWSEPATPLAELPLAPEIATRLEMLPELSASEPEVLATVRLQLTGPDPVLAERAFAVLTHALDRPLLVLDVAAALRGAQPYSLLLDCALREARLSGGALLLGHAEGLLADERADRLDETLRKLEAFVGPAAIELGTAAGADVVVGVGRFLPFFLASPTVEMRRRLWSARLADGTHELADPAATAEELALAFQLTHSQIQEAARSAHALARRRDIFLARVDRADLFAACRALTSRQLVAFAQRIEPRRELTLEHLVLPPINRQQLLELHDRVGLHADLHRAMQLGHAARQGRGVLALFVGGSGTGKTMAAEALAGARGVDLYRVDLAALVSKWVGETEQNLSRIFADAERANCMLFFDEADAIFGRRGEVKEARDRWANLEVNYLLQRVEEFTGVVILATNFRQNIDEAFQRRFHVIAEFPMPDAESRRRIWAGLLPDPGRHSVTPGELDELAARFELSGGNIRNVVLDACFRAVKTPDRRLTVRHLVASAAREYQKIVRSVTRGEFGPVFYEWAMEDVIAPAAPAAVPEPVGV
jgi:hypothetical protein